MHFLMPREALAIYSDFSLIYCFRESRQKSE